MQPLVYHGGFASYAFFAAFGTFAVGETLLQARQRTGARDPSYVWMVAGSVAGIALAFALAGERPRLPGPEGPWVALGVATMVAGIAIRAWAIRVLGRFFKVTVGVEEGQRLVDTGPYARLRHPSYSGLILIYVGAGLGLDSLLSVAAAAIVPSLAIAYRIHHEERLLRARLGEAYERYARRTRRLVPGLW